MAAGKEDSLEELRSAIADKIGRCVLVLQQYELQLKRLLVSQESSGTADSWEANHARRKAEFGGQTLGQLVRQFTSSVIRPSSDDTEEVSVKRSNQEVSDVSFHFRYSIEVDQEHYETICADLEALVLLRNDLVHHFLERFPTTHEADGCHAAIRFLDETLKTARDKHRQLLTWAQSFDRVRHDAAELMQTPGFHDAMAYGYAPGQETHWPSTPIVVYLVEAEAQLGVDGWTSLEAASKWINSAWAELTPKKYECSNWRHLLHVTNLFERQKRPTPCGTRNQMWYRSKVSK